MNQLPTVVITGPDFSLTITPESAAASGGAGKAALFDGGKLTPAQWAAIIIAVIQAIAAALGAIPTARAKGQGGQHETPAT